MDKQILLKNVMNLAQVILGYVELQVLEGYPGRKVSRQIRNEYETAEHSELGIEPWSYQPVSDG